MGDWAVGRVGVGAGHTGTCARFGSGGRRRSKVAALRAGEVHAVGALSEAAEQGAVRGWRHGQGCEGHLGCAGGCGHGRGSIWVLGCEQCACDMGRLKGLGRTCRVHPGGCKAGGWVASGSGVAGWRDKGVPAAQAKIHRQQMSTDGV